MYSRHGDILFGAVTILFASFIYVQSSQLPTDSGGFSKLVSWILGGAGVVLLLKTIRRTETATRLFLDFQWTIFFTSLALWFLAILLIPIVGFFCHCGNVPIFIGVVTPWVATTTGRALCNRFVRCDHDSGLVVSFYANPST